MNAGWKNLGPTVWLYGLAVLSFLLAIFMGFWVVVSVGATLQGAPIVNAQGGEQSTGIFLALGPPLVGMFFYSTGYLLLVRLRYNADGLERTFLGRRVFHPWATLDRLDRHWFFGPRVRLKAGGGIVVWDTLKGFETFVADASASGLKIDL